MVKLADQRTIRFDHNSKFLRRLRFIPSNYSHKIYERFRRLILAHARWIRFSNACRNSCTTAEAAAERVASLL